MRGREKLEQSKASWRLGLGNHLNGPICPICLSSCLAAESGEDDSRRPSCFPPVPSPRQPVVQIHSVTSGVPGTNHQTSLRAVDWSHTSLRWCFPLYITPGDLAMGALCIVPSFQSLYFFPCIHRGMGSTSGFRRAGSSWVPVSCLWSPPFP